MSIIDAVVMFGLGVFSGFFIGARWAIKGAELDKKYYGNE